MDTSEHIKEVYARFGLGVYCAQVLEHGIVNTMVILQFPERERITRSDIDKFMGIEFKQTLGTLLRHLKSYTPISEELENLLSNALEKRNWLCHNYFRERAVEFMTFEGRCKMLIELDIDREIIEQADVALSILVRPLSEQFGITEIAIQAEIDKLLQ